MSPEKNRKRAGEIRWRENFVDNEKLRRMAATEIIEIHEDISSFTDASTGRINNLMDQWCKEIKASIIVSIAASEFILRKSSMARHGIKIYEIIVMPRGFCEKFIRKKCLFSLSERHCNS